MKLFLILLMAFSINCFAQDRVKVVDAPNVSKEELHNRAVMFITSEARSANDVIQLNDKENGILISKGGIKYDAPAFAPGTNYSGWFRITVKIESKEGKYKYTVSNPIHESYLAGYSMGNVDNKTKKKIRERAIYDVDLFCEELEEGMMKSYKSDW